MKSFNTRIVLLVAILIAAVAGCASQPNDQSTASGPLNVDVTTYINSRPDGEGAMNRIGDNTAVTGNTLSVTITIDSDNQQDAAQTGGPTTNDVKPTTDISATGL